MKAANDQITNYYQSLFKIHGVSPKALGWDKGKQFLRFHQLTSDWELNGNSILDVGCGFGDFVNYLQSAGIENYSYSGIDLVGDFVEAAKILHGSPRARFLQASLEDYEEPSIFDYSIASGVFNLRVDCVDGYELIAQSMKRMFQLSRIALSIDFISSKVDYTHKHNFNSEPEKILAMAYTLSRNVVLKNNYFPFEFSVTIYKDDSFSQGSTTFSSIEKKFPFLKSSVGTAV
jgi:SAM-dependent methyltransferase